MGPGIKKLNTVYLGYTLLGFAALAVYITGLFPETTVDSAKYATVSRQILETGDLIHLKVRGEAYLQKPPLLFWLGALSFRIFGISILAFKLPTLIVSVLGIYSTYRLGRLIDDHRTGLIAALLYGSSEAHILYSMDVHTDLLMTALIVFAIWQLAEYLEKRRTLNFILGFAGIGLAMISKGLIGLAVPVFSVTGYLLAKRDYRSLFSWRWLAGLPILVLILYPALKGSYDQFGLEGLKFYFWSNNIDRMRGYYTDGQRDLSFCFHTILYLFLPWSLYAYTAIVGDFRQWCSNGYAFRNIRSMYLYPAIILLAAIISVSNQQAPHYMLPILPLLAILTARYINEISGSTSFPRTYRWMLVARTMIVVVIWPMILLLIFYFFPTKNAFILLPLLILFSLSVYGLFASRTKLQKLLFSLVSSILALGFVSNTVYFPSANNYHGPIQASHLYNRIAADNSRLYTYDYILFEPYFYAKSGSWWLSDEQLGEILTGDPCWIFTTEKGYQKICSEEGTMISEQYSFPYKKLTNISFRFLNPKTREQTLHTVYLLKIH